jgi:hypothetical protein
LEGCLNFRNTDRTIRLYAHSLCRINVELVVIKKDNAGRGASEVREDIFEDCTRGLKVADLMRQVVVMQEAVES